jgi:hypothetical protein
MRSLPISFAVAALLVAAGCSSTSGTSPAALSSDAAGPVTPASGTRLHAKLVTGGGAREVVGFHDTKRDEDCTFQPAEDGHIRCLPQSIVQPPQTAYADAACTVPLVQVPVQQAPGCTDAPKYAMTLDGFGCGGPKELRKLVPSSGPRYSNNGSGCTVQQVSPSSPPLFALGDTVSLLELVEAKVTTGAPLGNGVSETLLLGIDGSRQHYGYRADALDVDCSFEIMADGVMRCLPKDGRGAVLYSDDACTRASAVRIGSGCPANPGRFWLDAPGPDTCRSVSAVYSLAAYHGGASDPAYVHQFQGGSSGTVTTSCYSQGFGLNGDDLRSVNADVTPSLPTFSRIGTGSGRLVPALVADASNPSLVSRWHDTERDVDCAFTRADDGKLRCLPTTTEAKLFSTDGKCSSPTRVAVFTEVPCTGSSGFARVTSNTCPSTTRVLTVTGEPHDITNASSETTPGRCASFASVQKVYDTTEVDPAQFVEGVEGPE